MHSTMLSITQVLSGAVQTMLREQNKTFEKHNWSIANFIRDEKQKSYDTLSAEGFTRAIQQLLLAEKYRA
jgi:hypothetical protein